MPEELHMKTFSLFGRFDKVMIYFLLAFTTACGEMDLRLKLQETLPSLIPSNPVVPTTPGTLPAYSLKSMSLDHTLGRHTFLGFPLTKYKHFDLANNQESTLIEPTYGIRVFDSNGNVIRHLPIPSIYSEILKEPTYIQDSAGHYYIGSSWDHRNNGEEKRILKISPTGTITVFPGSPNAVDGYTDFAIIRNASNVEELHVGYMVFDLGTGIGLPTSIDVLALDGTFVRTYGSENQQTGYIMQAPSSDIFLMPHASALIRRFSADGTYQELIDLCHFLDSFHYTRIIDNGLMVGVRTQSGSGIMYLERLDLSTNPATRLSAFSKFDHPSFTAPMDVAISPDGNYVDATVGDPTDPRITRARYRFNGTNYVFEKYLTTAGSDNLQFSLPLPDMHTMSHSIKFSDSGNMYLLDQMNGRIQIASSNGAYLDEFSIATASINHAADSALMSMTLNSAGKIIIIASEASPSTQSLIRRYNPTTKSLEHIASVPSGKFIGIDSSDNVWLHAGTDLLQISPAGAAIKTISVADTTPYFGYQMLLYFQVIDSHIYSISGFDLTLVKSDFDGNSEVFIPGTDLVMANCYALLPYTMQKNEAGDLTVLSMDLDNIHNSSLIVINEEHGRIIQRIEGFNAKGFIGYNLRSDALWAYISENRLALYK